MVVEDVGGVVLVVPLVLEVVDEGLGLLGVLLPGVAAGKLGAREVGQGVGVAGGQVAAGLVLEERVGADALGVEEVDDVLGVDTKTAGLHLNAGAVTGLSSLDELNKVLGVHTKAAGVASETDDVLNVHIAAEDSVLEATS